MRARRWGIGIAAVLFVLINAPGCTQESPSSVPTPAERPAASATATLGGQTATTATASPATAAAPRQRGWQQRAPVPTPRTEVAAAVLDGRIYVAGGFAADGSTLATVEVYEPEHDR